MHSSKGTHIFVYLCIWPTAFTSDLTAPHFYEHKHMISVLISNHSMNAITIIDVTFSRLSTVGENTGVNRAQHPRQGLLSFLFLPGHAARLSLLTFSHLSGYKTGFVRYQYYHET